jgi:uncharacterized protein (TIGR02145 family)
MLRKNLRLVLGILILAGSALAVTGVVLDNLGKVVSRVKVELVAEGSSVITGSDGSFTLLPASSIMDKQSTEGIQVALKNGVLQFHLPVSVQGSLRTTDIRGKQVNSLPSQRHSAGDHQYSPLGNVLAKPGIYLVQYQLGNQKGVLKLAATNTFNTYGNKLNAVTPVLRLTPQSAPDSVRFSKKGYTSKSIAINDYDTILGNITLEGVATISSSTMAGSSSSVAGSSSVDASSSSVSGSSSSVAGSSSSIAGLSSSSIAGSSSSVDASSSNAMGSSSSSAIPSSSSVMGLTAQTITFTAPADKIYGATPFTLEANSNSGLTVAFTSANTNVCTVSGPVVTILGAGSCQITASQPGNGTNAPANDVVRILSVAKKSITVTAAEATSREYDGSITIQITNYAFDGVVNSDDVRLTTGTVPNKSVGTNKPVTVIGSSLGGAMAGNYTLTTYTALTVNITAKPLTITGASVMDKTYDGTTTATITGATLSGKVGSEAVTLSVGTATFANKNVGTGKSVTVTGSALAGADASNYTLTEISGITATIAQKPLTVTGAIASDKVYDGTTTATITGGTLSDIVSLDAVTLTVGTATFADKNVGTGKSVTVTGSALGGADAGNYTLTEISGLTANITPATLTFTSANPGTKLTANGAAFSNNYTVSPLSASVTFASTTPSVCLLTSGIVTLVSAGLCTIQAAVSDAGNYATSTATQSFDVDQFTDARDQKKYKMTKISTQIWMAENLNYDTLNGTGSWCYGVTSGNCDTYGRLYNLPTAINVCPAGWHMPTDNEWWNTLIPAVGGVGTAGKKLKAFSDLWSINTGTNDYGFSGLPGGFWNGSAFQGINEGGYWWSTTQTPASLDKYITHAAGYNHDFIAGNETSPYWGQSVRCVQDLPTVVTAPVFTVPGGSYTAQQTVKITSGTTGANIFYTTDGSTPTASSTPYSAPINTVSIGSQTIKAIAIKAGLTNSAVIGATYAISLKDIRDSKYYKTVTIGTQVWMAENLNVGTKLLSTGDQSNDGVTQKYCYNDDEAKCTAYGGLYQWAEALELASTYNSSAGAGFISAGNHKGICPTGWHIPKTTEWNTLDTYLGSTTAGTKMKLNVEWSPTNTGTNASGFSALPGGYRVVGSGFGGLSESEYFWDATEVDGLNAKVVNLFQSSATLNPSNILKTGGYSVRCLKDLPSQTINFTAPTSKTYGDAALPLTATATSTLAVTYASTTTSVCTVSGSIVTLAGAGTCSITASQAGNEYFSPATDVIRTFTVATKAVTVTATPKTKVFGSADPALTFTTTGLVGSDALTGGLSRTGGEDVGAYAITSTLTNSNYAITFISADLTITKASFVFTSANPGTKLTADGFSFSNTFTVGSGVTASYASITPLVCTYAIFTVTLVRAGVCTIQATASPPGNYNTATQSFDVDMFTDARDGNRKYKLVKIGTQTWMAENLNYGTQVNGTLSTANQSQDGVVEKYCYGDDINNCNTDGGLYQWAEAMALPSACNTATTPGCGGAINTGNHQGLCPTNWHIPKTSEWTALITALGGSAITAGGKMKLNNTNYTEWNASTYNNGNSSGFSALPAGYRGSTGNFSDIGNMDFFWEASESDLNNANYRLLNRYTEAILLGTTEKKYGYSVRCVQD